MTEPDWEAVRARLMARTVRDLRAIGRAWFPGSLGGASAKAECVGEMVAQMRHWWRVDGGAPRWRVGEVLDMLEEMEAGNGR